MTEPTTLPAMHHVAFACRDPDETHRFYGEVLGLELVHTEIQKFPHGWCQSVYFHDPNGILVELCADTPGLPRDPERAEELRHIPPTATMR